MPSPSRPAMEQQAWILRGFLAQVESKEAEVEEAESGFTGEFLRLKRQSIKYRTDKTYPTKIADKQENVKKNRYKDIVPFDHSRVKLSLTTSKNDNDYINASFIKGVSGDRAYIATQGPLPHTVLDFWRMLWEYDTEVIVMVCREFEMGRKKCERYWPKKQEEPFVCDPFTIYCDSEESKGDYVSRNLRVTYRNWSRTLRQLHYINWPDHGVPDTIPPILELLQEMRAYQAHEDVPICIHCSAGCGRTGALCAIDYTWNLVKTQLLTEDFNIFDLVKDMRTQRPSVVQTKEQYELLYRTIKFLFEKYLQSMAPVPPSCTEEVPVAPSPPTASDSELSDLSEESEAEQEPEPELQPKMEPQTEHRHTESEEPGGISNHAVPVAFFSPEVHVDPLCDAAKCSPSAILNALRARDRQREQQRPYSLPTQTVNQKPQPRKKQPNNMAVNQRPPYPPPTQPNYQRPYFLHTQPANLPNSQDLRQEPSPNIPIIPPQALRPQEFSQIAMEQEKVEMDGEITTLVIPVLPVDLFSNPLCLTMEDPYFGPDSPLAAKDPRGSDDEEEQAPLSQWTENPCFNGPSLTLNSQLMELPALTTTSAAPGAVSSDEDSPPPLPERTAESYVLAAGAERSDNISKPKMLEIILPSNAEAEALRGGNGSPPSPIPPLPERTPESFVLANDAGRSTPVFPPLSVPVEKMVQDRPKDSRIGTSLEWCGRLGDTPALVEKRSWTRSRSLKVKMTTLSVSPPVTVSPPVIVPPLVVSLVPAPCTSIILPPPPPPPYPLVPTLSPPERLTPPLPERTPESFIVVMQDGEHISSSPPPSQSSSSSFAFDQNSTPCLQSLSSQTTTTQQRIGTSSEWSGNSQPKRFLDGIMNRSKSVRAKSSRKEHLTTVHLVAPAVVALATRGSAEMEHQQPVVTSISTGSGTTDNKSDMNSGKSMSRTKSLKFFKHRQKPKTAPPPATTHSGSPPSNGASASSSVFKFGFGSRFVKPKGPRTHPETWF